MSPDKMRRSNTNTTAGKVLFPDSTTDCECTVPLVLLVLRIVLYDT